MKGIKILLLLLVPFLSHAQFVSTLTNIPASSGNFFVVTGLSCGASTTFSINSGFTISDQVNQNTSGAPNFWYGGSMAYLITSSTTPLNPQWSWITTPSSSAAMIADFKSTTSVSLIAHGIGTCLDVVTYDTVNIGATNTTGSTIEVIAVTCNGTTHGTRGTLTDSKSNTWVYLGNQIAAASIYQLFYYYCINPVTASNQTFRYVGVFLSEPSMFMTAASGTFTTIDQNNGNNTSNSGSLSINTGSITP